jgi:hypothetical protein
MNATLKRSARGEINQLPCVFNTALSRRCAVCSLALQDAEHLLCTQPLARAACASLHGLLREKARFVLGQRHEPLAGPSSSAAELRLQCGGLSGLRAALDADAIAIDVSRLLEQLALTEIDTLPWEQILRAISISAPAR